MTDEDVEYTNTITQDDMPSVSRVRAFAIISWVTIAIIVFLTASFTLAQIWPYNDLTIDHVSTITSNEATSDGIPVVREGEEVVFTVTLCNTGVDVQTDRWLDSYGDSISALEFSRELDLSKRSSSLMIREAVFYVDEPLGCLEDIRGGIELSDTVPTGFYYKMRTNNTYTPNHLTDVNVPVETELFYYAGIDEELP